MAARKDLYMASRKPTSLHLPAAPRAAEPAHTVGHLESLTPEGAVEVRLRDRVAVARIALSCTDAELIGAVRTKSAVLIAWADGDLGQPIIVGFVRDRLRGIDEPVAPNDRYVEVDASAGIRLRSGNASIELRPDGRVEIRATDIVSVAEARQVIVGGTVDIN